MRRVRDKARLYLNDVLWGERELSTPCAACTVQARVACVPVPVYTASAAVRPERALAKIRLSAGGGVISIRPDSGVMCSVYTVGGTRQRKVVVMNQKLGVATIQS